MKEETLKMWQKLPELPDEVERKVLRFGYRTGSRVFGCDFIPDETTALDLILNPELSCNWRYFMNNRLGVYEEGYAGEHFDSVYVKLSIASYPVNLLFFHNNQVRRAYMKTTRVMRRWAKDPYLRRLLSIKEHRITLFECVRDEILKNLQKQ